MMRHKMFRFFALFWLLLFLWSAAATLTLAAATSPVIKNKSPETSLSAVLPPHRPLLQSGSTLTVTKTAYPQPVEAGQAMTYTIVISNNNTSNATGVTLSDTITGYISLIAGSVLITPGSAGGVTGTQPIIAHSITVAAQSLVTVTYKVSVTQPLTRGVVITNVAAVTSTQISTPATSLITSSVKNSAPAANAASFTTDEDTPFSNSLTASDANNDVLTYSISVAPAHGTVSITNSSTGNFVYTPTANYNGQDAFTFLVSDAGNLSDTAPVTLTISAVNDAPVLNAIGNKSIDEESVLTFTAVATDVDSSDTLTFTLNNAPAGATISPTSGLFSWTPTEAQGAGSYTLTVIVSDNASPVLSDSETISITVNEVNLPPVLNPIGNKTIDEEDVLTFTASATDPDDPANTLSFSLNNAPAGATISPTTGLFSWAPTEAQGPDTYTLTVIVSDDGSPVLTDSETITITVNEVNLPPILNPIGDKNIDEQRVLTFTASATDPDRPANALTFSLSGAPANASIAPSSGYFTWTPLEAEGPDSYTFDVIVRDNGTPVLSDSETITVTVNEVNRPPVLGAIGGQTVDEGNQLSFTASATDPDAPPNALSFSLSSAPSGASITTGGDFTWTPTELQGPGVYTAVVVVQDDGSPVLTDSETISITVNEINTAPVLAHIGDQSVDEEDTLSFTLSATDSDLPSNGLIYGMSNAPTGANITTGGDFTWTPTAAQGPGVYAVTFVVTDTGSPALTDSETISITVVEIADVSVNKTAPSSAMAGSSNSIRYRLRIQNINGPSEAKNVVITDTLPPGVTFDYADPETGSCSQTNDKVRCELGTLVTSTLSTIIDIYVKVNSSTTGTLTNTAIVASDTTDRILTNNTHTATTTVTTRADLTLSKNDSADPVLLLDPLIYTLTITNNGPSDATGVTLNDTLPVSVTFAAASTGCAYAGGVVNCSPGTLTAGSTQMVSIVVTPTATGLLNNQATVSSNITDPTPGNNSAAEATTILPKADLSISKTGFPDPVAALDTLTYTLTIVNNGPSDAPGVVVTDTLPLTAAIVSVTPMTTAQNGQTLYWHPGTLNTGASRAITIVVSPQTTGALQNTAAVGSAIADHVASNNTASQHTAVTTRVDLAVSQNASANPVTAGTLLTYTLTVSNYGPSQGTSIVVSDTLPSEVSFVSAPGCAENGGVVSCALSSLSPGNTASLPVTVKVNSSAAGTLTNTIRVRGYEFDPDAANNTTGITTGVIIQADLSLSKTASPSPVIAGNALTYTLVIANNGPSDASDALLTDTLPLSLNLVSAASTQGSCSGQSVIVCTPSDINSEESVTVTLVTLVDAAKRGTLNNTAIVRSAADDPLPGNNAAALQSTVNALSDLVLSARDSADPIVAGNQLTYHLSITNAGPSKATNVLFADQPPLSNVSLDLLAVSQGSCITDPVLCSLGDLLPGNSAAVTITMTVDESFSGLLTNAATVAADEDDPDDSNNNVEEETTVTPSTYYIFLPLIIKSPPPRTDLSVFNDDTGGNVTFSVLGTNVSCTVPNNTTRYCGSFSPGTYTVHVVAPCGTAETQKTYEAGPQTTRVYCDATNRSTNGRRPLTADR